MTIMKYIFKFLIIVFCVGFVISNLQDIEFYYSPFSSPITAPLWLVGLGLFIMGFVAGTILVWFNMLPKRFELRRIKKERDELIKERDQLTQDLYDRTSDLDPSTPPALTESL